MKNLLVLMISFVMIYSNAYASGNKKLLQALKADHVSHDFFPIYYINRPSMRSIIGFQCVARDAAQKCTEVTSYHRDIKEEKMTVYHSPYPALGASYLFDSLSISVSDHAEREDLKLFNYTVKYARTYWNTDNLGIMLGAWISAGTIVVPLGIGHAGAVSLDLFKLPFRAIKVKALKEDMKTVLDSSKEIVTALKEWKKIVPIELNRKEIFRPFIKLTSCSGELNYNDYTGYYWLKDHCFLY